MIVDWTKFTVENDPFDVMAFRRVFEQSGKLQETLDRKRLATAEELGNDVFSTLYKYSPTLKPEHDIDSSYLFNRGLVEKAIGTQEYDRLRAVTRLAEMESALATEIITKELLEALPEEDRQAVNEYAKAHGNLENALEKLKALQGLPKQSPRSKGAMTRLNKQMPGLQQAVQNAQQAFQQACQNPQVMAALRAAIGHAASELELANDFAGGWGLQPGQLTKVPPQERLDLMRRIVNSPKIRELSRLIGRFKRLAFQKRYTRVTSEPNEVSDVKLSADVTRVLPTELLYLSDKTTEILFFEKLVTRRLLTYEMKGRETFGRGPIIILIDNSGSMAAGVGGITAEMWAKAMGLAMAEIALKDKRDIEFINFSSRGQTSKHVVPHTLPPAERVRKLIEAAEEFYGGGTDFETPLSEAMEDVRTSQFKKADIVMVTDGICETSEAFEKEFHDLKEKTGVRLHTVVIGEHSESLERLSDTYSPLYDLLSQGDAAAGKLFESV